MTETFGLNGAVGLLPDNYLFSQMRLRASQFAAAHPDVRLLDLGVGDVTGPVARCVADAGMHAFEQYADIASFRGYGPENGYAFLREAIRDYYASELAVTLSEEDIFAGDGAKSAIDRIMGCFTGEVLLPVPAYPAYRECALARGLKPVFLEKRPENGFLPLPDGCKMRPRLIVLCSPDNPTGAAMDAQTLQKWVDYARSSGSVILFDAAYERFAGKKKPRSVFVADGAKECCVEIGSLSKSACFTGIRAGWTVVPAEIMGGKLKKTYRRLLGCCYNGVPYAVQRAAQAALSRGALSFCGEYAESCLRGARILKSTLEASGAEVCGGEDSPYLWLRCICGDGCETAEKWLTEAGIIVTPGEGFGRGGEGFIRLSALGGEKRAASAAARIKKVFGAALR